MAQQAGDRRGAALGGEFRSASGTAERCQGGWKRHPIVKQKIREIEQTRLELLEQAPAERAHAMVRLLARVIGIGVETADMLVQEVLSRNMRDRRAVAVMPVSPARLTKAGPNGVKRD